jgi:excisionase family DNA binding protein
VETKTELLTIKAAALALSQAEVTLRQKVARREIGVVRIGRSVRIPRSELTRLIERGYIPPAPERAR